MKKVAFSPSLLSEVNLLHLYFPIHSPFSFHIFMENMFSLSYLYLTFIICPLPVLFTHWALEGTVYEKHGTKNLIILLCTHDYPKSFFESAVISNPSRYFVLNPDVSCVSCVLRIHFYELLFLDIFLIWKKMLENSTRIHSAWIACAEASCVLQYSKTFFHLLLVQ